MAHASDQGPFQAVSATREDPKAAIVQLLRRYGTQSTRLAQVFAEKEQVQPVDIRALVAVIDAERDGDPLTPGRLRRLLGLSSAGTSYVIDRLEAAGHVRRWRDEERDSRVVHVRHTPEAARAAQAFFSPLGAATQAVLDDFDGAQIEAIALFLGRACEVLEEYSESVGAKETKSAEGPAGPFKRASAEP